MKNYFSAILSLFVFLLIPIEIPATPSPSIDSSEKKCILLVGGAGFVGSHVNAMLNRAGYSTVVLDDLSSGSKKMIKQGYFYKGNYGDQDVLDKIFKHHSIDAVMHFAGFLGIEESIKIPLKYYVNNLANSILLLQTMEKYQIKTFIFSSSSTVYGNVPDDNISESYPLNAFTPYARSKLMIETILQDLDAVDEMRYCNLRYFSPAGGDPLNEIKNTKPKDYGLIPTILRRIRAGNNTISIFGTDYSTPDGTGVRDYVHIQDIGSAHILALENLFSGGSSASYNIGTGVGISVREIIAAAEKVTGQSLQVIEEPRRLGDPGRIVADITKIQEELGWIPEYSSIEQIIQDGWNALHDL